MTGRAVQGTAYIIISIFIILRLIALFSVPMVGDEPDDLTIISIEQEGLNNFFYSPRAYEFDQARLPFYLSIPVILMFPENPIIPLRVLFFIFHLIYLGISYKLIRYLYDDKESALAYLVALSVSCFIASFSIFSITTSDNLYLLFHILSIYVFMKRINRYKETNIFNGVVLLILILSLCIASKLFGVLLMISLFIYMFLVKGKGWHIKIRAVPPLYLVAAGSIFLSCIILINILEISSSIKMGMAIGLSILYLAVMVYFMIREKHQLFPVKRVHFILFWVGIVLSAFCFTLIFSPTYLNLKNLIIIPTWFSQWGSGEFISRSNYYDMLVIIVLKFGLPSSAALVMVFGLLLFVGKDKLIQQKTSGNLVLLVIFIIHFITISLVKFKVTWYPLAVFPFLYLPFVILWHKIRSQSYKKLKILFLCLSLLLLSDNVYRYLHWFPYGHFDGAQYGREQIGWNRAGFVSFEALPPLIDYLETIKTIEGGSISCQVVDVSFYNTWFRILIEREYSRLNTTPFRFSSGPFQKEADYDYILTSPVYYPEFEQKLKEISLEEIKTFTIKEIDILRLWKY